MALSFNHGTKRIGVPQADAQPLPIQALINAIRTEEASERGIAHPQIADAAGKDSLGGLVAVGITVSLRSTWALDFEAGAYQATVDGGNLSDALNKVVNTGNPQVLFLASAAATVVSVGSGLSPEEQTKLDELHKIHGLKTGAPLTVTPTSRAVTGVSQTIGESGDTVTVTRT